MMWTALWWAGGVAGGCVALWVLASAAGLELPAQGASWRLLDSTRATIDEGTGMDAGLAALFDAAQLGPTAPTPAITDAELVGIAGLAEAFRGAGGGRPAAFAALLGPTGLRPTGQSMTALGHHTFHRASPWGIAAGVATPAGLVVVAGVLLGFLGWSRRRMVVVGVRVG